VTRTARIDPELKKDAESIFKAALAAVEPAAAVANAVQRSGDVVKILQGKRAIKTLNLKKFNRIFLVGAGKATAPMAKAMEKILGAKVADGVISVKTGHGLKLKKTKVMEASHPMPDEAGVEAAQAIKNLLESAGKDDLVFSLISGGGSALLPLPSEGLKLKEKQAATKLLLDCGATIHEMNTVRKHLSQVKGGQLARAAAPATVINLMLSDVVGDDMDTIASGPLVPDHTTFDDMAFILAKYQLMKKAPKAVRTHMQKGLTGEIPETPKEGDPIFSKVTNLIVGANILALKAAAAEAKDRGYKPLILSSQVQGETREVALAHTAMAKEILASAHPVKRPACLISGGETTVTIKGDGMGGRNQEFALASALDIDGLNDVLILSAGTDGTDGPTDAAGAAVDGTTVSRAGEQGLSPLQHLDENNAYPFFEALNDLIKTGPTRTNVMDVRLVLVR
jgi:hydroxypyruvate reductase